MARPMPLAPPMRYVRLRAIGQATRGSKAPVKAMILEARVGKLFLGGMVSTALQV